MSKHTAIKDKLEFYELHVDKVRSNGLVTQAHSNMFQLHQVSLKRIVKSIFKRDKFRYLLKSVSELYKG
jgi:hypothetical protein